LAEGASPGARMVDVGGKEDVPRMATARGEIILSRKTVEAIREGRIEKGDVAVTAQVAGVMALKRPPELIPLCHSIPITSARVEVEVLDDRVAALCNVSASYKTGVEMEALVGVSAALLTVWDMVKYLEKDETGNYPSTRIAEIRVLEKRKEG